MDLANVWYSYLQKNYKNYPANTNRASIIGHPCLRYLYYCRVKWQEKLPPDIAILRAYEGGKDGERIVIERLKKMGYVIVREQEPAVWSKYQLSGTIDGILKEGEKQHVIEVKNMSTNNYNRLNCPEDFRKEYYLAMYIAQVQVYMILLELESAYMILRNKNNDDMKSIAIPLDYDYAEKLLRKSEIINEHIANNTEPSRTEDEYCSECGFFHVCKPSIVQKQAVVDFAGELDSLLSRKENLKKQIVPYQEELEKIQEKIDLLLESALAKGIEKIVTENFLMQAKKIIVRERMVPGYSYWKWNTKILGARNGSE